MEIIALSDGVADYWRADNDRWIRGVTWHRKRREVRLWWAHRSEVLCRKGGEFKGHRSLGRAADRAAADRMARTALDG